MLKPKIREALPRCPECGTLPVWEEDIIDNSGWLHLWCLKCGHCSFSELFYVNPKYYPNREWARQEAIRIFKNA